MVFDFNQFWKDQAIWSQATFGTDEERGPVGPLKHLALEVLIELLGFDRQDFEEWEGIYKPEKYTVDKMSVEAREKAKAGYTDGEKVEFRNPDSMRLLYEFADLQFLIVDACRRAGFTPTMLLGACFTKLAINRARKWPRPTPDQPVEHIRGND